jgi:glycosyltransferase involved in cell wall biosynthesis
VPVLASTRGALPEVTGDAALLLPPDDAGAWADALRRVLSDKDLRATLSQRGLVRAQAFSWDESARTLGAVYLAAAERRKARQR